MQQQKWYLILGLSVALTASVCSYLMQGEQTGIIATDAPGGAAGGCGSAGGAGGSMPGGSFLGGLFSFGASRRELAFSSATSTSKSLARPCTSRRWCTEWICGERGGHSTRALPRRPLPAGRPPQLPLPEGQNPVAMLLPGPPRTGARRYLAGEQAGAHLLGVGVQHAALPVQVALLPCGHTRWGVWGAAKRSP